MCLGGLEDYGRKFTNIYQQTWQKKLRPKRWESGKRSPDLESQVISSPWSNTSWLSFLKSSYLDTHQSRPFWNDKLRAFLATFCRGLELQGFIGEGTYYFLSNSSIEVQHHGFKKNDSSLGSIKNNPPKVDFVNVSTCDLRMGNFNSSKAGVVTSHKNPYMRGRCHSFRLMVQLKIKLCNNIKKESMGRRRTVYLPTNWSHKKSTIHVSVKQTKKVPGDPWGTSCARHRSLAWFHWSALLYGLRGRLSLDNRYPLKKMFTADWNQQNHPKKKIRKIIYQTHPKLHDFFGFKMENFAGVILQTTLLLQLFWSYRGSHPLFDPTLPKNHPHSTLPWPLWPSLHSWPSPPRPDKDLDVKTPSLAILLMEEIWQAPVDMLNIPLFTGFYTSPSGARFLPSTVCSATKTKRQSSWENDKGSKEDALLPGSSDFQLWRSASSYMNFGICNILS